MTDATAPVWAARRALVEDFGAPIAQVALAGRIGARAIEVRAIKEGWKVSSPAGGLTRAERIARVHDRLLEKVERAQLQGEADAAPLDKASIAELSATARILAKISEGMRDEDAAKEQQMERDADIAAILDRLDERIVGLARHLAEELAGERLIEPGAVRGQP